MRPNEAPDTAATEWCPDDENGMHCDHWWDDVAPCCGCGDDTDAGLSDAAPGRKPGERV
jgi:hypothetical protein